MQQLLAIYGKCITAFAFLTKPVCAVHRFLWRNSDATREPDTYVTSVLSFGDNPALAMALTAPRKTAETDKDDIPDASDTIRRNSYMDEVCSSVDTSSEAEIDKILNRHGFKAAARRFLV